MSVRIGFVGAGGIAQHHLRQLAGIADAAVVAVCDIDETRAKAAAEPLGAAVYADPGSLLARERLDALYVCVPPHVHGTVEIDAARRGLHLFVEKPVNLYLDRALQAADAVRAAGVLSLAGYMTRYYPAHIRLHRLLAGKEIGTAHAFRWCGLPGAPWWRRYDQGGGQLVEMTTHQVDILRWVMGEVVAVSADYSFGRLLKDEAGVTVPDSQAALLRFESGASATVSTSCAAGRAGLLRLEFLVRGGRIALEDETLQAWPDDAFELPPAPAETPSIDEAFVRAVRTGDATLLKSPFDDAVKTLAVTLAANRSAEEGGRLVTVAELLP